MRVYLVEKPDWFTGQMEIPKFYQSVNIQDFLEDRMYGLPQRLFMEITHKEFAEYPGLLLEPIPLFEENLWKTILQCMPKPLDTQFIFMEENTRRSISYHCPAFQRIKGSVRINGRRGERQAVHLLLEKKLPKDVPAFYLQEEGRVRVLLQLDLVESFMRVGLNDVRLLPVVKEEVKF